MATLTHTSPTGKAPRAYYAILDDVHGVLMQDETGAIVFMADDTYALTTIQPAHLPFLMPLGEVGLAEAARLADIRHGGAAQIACSREFWRN
jgi:hypothetical protein